MAPPTSDGRSPGDEIENMIADVFESDFGKEEKDYPLGWVNQFRSRASRTLFEQRRLA